MQLLFLNFQIELNKYSENAQNRFNFLVKRYILKIKPNSPLEHFAVKMCLKSVRFLFSIKEYEGMKKLLALTLSIASVVFVALPTEAKTNNSGLNTLTVNASKPQIYIQIGSGRGYNRRYNRRSYRSYNRGYNRVYSRSYSRGYNRGYYPAYNRSYSRSYSRVYYPTYNRSYNQGYSRSYSRGYSYNRGYSPSYNRSYSRSYIRGYRRGFRQGYQQRANRSSYRNYRSVYNRRFMPYRRSARGYSVITIQRY